MERRGFFHPPKMFSQRETIILLIERDGIIMRVKY